MTTAMSTDTATRPVSTAGAWLGFGVAAWSAMGVFWNVAVLAAVSAIPLFVDAVTRMAERETNASDIPPQFDKLMTLVVEGERIIEPWADATAGSGILLGFALFCGAAMLVRGSEFGRRATRVLLVLHGLQSVGAAAWLFVLATTRIAEWHARFQSTIDELATQAPRGGYVFPKGPALSIGEQVAFHAVGVAVGLAVTGTLFWLAGRPFARDWCAARSRRNPIASADLPR